MPNDKTHSERLASLLPKLSSYYHLKRLEGMTFTYRAAYELFVRNSQNIESINSVISKFKTGNLLDIEKDITALGFPIVNYPEGHPYLHNRIDSEFFVVINEIHKNQKNTPKFENTKIINKTTTVNYTIKQMSKGFSYELNTKNKIHERASSGTFKISIEYVEDLGDIIYTELIQGRCIKKGAEGKVYYQRAIEHGDFVTFKHIPHILLPSDYMRKISYHTNYKKHPLLISRALVSFNIDSPLIKYGNFSDTFKHINKASRILEGHIAPDIKGEAYEEFLVIFKNNKQEKFIEFLCIYDSYQLYKNKIKEEFTKTLEEENNSMKLRAETLWTAILHNIAPSRLKTTSDQEEKKYIDDLTFKRNQSKIKAIRNTYSYINKIINEKFYELI